MGQRDDETGRHFHATEDLPTGRGPGKVVTTDILRDAVDTLNNPSGAAISGYDNSRTGILAPDGTAADTVQEAIDGLLYGGPLLIVPAQFNGSAPIPANTGVRRFLVVTTTGVNASIGELLFDNGTGTGTMQKLAALEGRLISITDALVGGTIEFAAETVWQWDADGGAWDQVGDGSFLGPNEFYVDNTLLANNGRQCPTLAAVLVLAAVLFPAGEEIIVRFREGQDHITGPITIGALIPRNVTLYAEGMTGGPGSTLNGSLTLGGATLAALGPAGLQSFEFRGLNLAGTLTIHTGWRVIAKDCTFGNGTAGLNIVLNEDAGVDIAPSFSAEDCDCDTTLTGTVHQINVTTANPGGAAHAAATFNRCTLSLVRTAALGAPIIMDHAVLGFADCVIALANSDDGTVVIEGATLFTVIWDWTVINAVFTSGPDPSVVGIMDTPALVIYNSLDVNVTAPAGVKWGTQAASILVAGAPVIRRMSTTPSFALVGTTMPDETLNSLTGGREGPGSTRTLDDEGYWMAPGSFIYGSVLGTDGPVPFAVQIAWYNPDSDGSSASPTELTLRIGPNRMVRYKITVVAHEELSGSVEVGAWEFSGVLLNNAGVATQPVGPNKVTVLSSAGAPTADVLFDPFTSSISVYGTGVANKSMRWRAKAEWLVV